MRLIMVILLQLGNHKLCNRVNSGINLENSMVSENQLTTGVSIFGRLEFFYLFFLFLRFEIGRLELIIV